MCYLSVAQPKIPQTYWCKTTHIYYLRVPVVHESRHGFPEFHLRATIKCPPVPESHLKVQIGKEPFPSSYDYSQNSGP